jgi:hypothetical protein
MVWIGREPGPCVVIVLVKSPAEAETAHCGMHLLKRGGLKDVFESCAISDNRRKEGTHET